MFVSPLSTATPKFAGTNQNALALTPEQIKAFQAAVKTVGTDAAGLTEGTVGKGVKALQAAVKKLVNDIPQGKFSIDKENTQYVIDPFDGDAAEPLKLPGTRKVFGPGTNVKEFLTEAFGEKPKLVICPVGWTVPDPDYVAMANQSVADRFAEKREELSKTLEGEALEKAFTKAKKNMLKELYQAAFTGWWSKVSDNFEQLIKDSGLKPGEVCFLTSASYDGIDKAAIDYAQSKGMKIANVTPFAYARWLEPKFEYPLLITNSITDYADVCSEADVVLATGGREHTLNEDAARGLIGRKNTVIPVDILREEFGIDVPATKNGKLENAARYLQEQGFRVAGMKLAENPPMIPGLTESQRDTVTVLKKLFAQINIGK